MLPAQEDHPWISIGKFLNWTTEKIWTKRGATFFCIASILIGIFWYYEDDRPWMILLSPLAILVLVVFLFLAGFAAVIESFASPGSILDAVSSKHQLSQAIPARHQARHR